MSLEKVEASLKKKKIQLNDYKTESVFVDLEESIQKKNKVGFYFSDEILHKFNEIYGKKLLERGKLDRSTLICEMINYYYENQK